VKMIFLVEGTHHYLVKIDEIPEDIIADVIDDLQEIDLIVDTRTHTVMKQIL
jgi:hypothetical protein